MSDINELEKEITWLKHELALVPVSRKRMMGRTVLASYERDMYRELCRQLAPDKAKQIEAQVYEFAYRNKLMYVLEKQVTDRGD